jgi:hypothetical protein
VARSTYTQDGDLNLPKWIPDSQLAVEQKPDLYAPQGTVWFGQFRQASDRVDLQRYHYWGCNPTDGGDATTGEMRSETFTLAGMAKSIS